MSPEQSLRKAIQGDRPAKSRRERRRPSRDMRGRPSLARRFALRLMVIACSLLISRMVFYSESGREMMQSVQATLTEVIQTEMVARRAASAPQVPQVQGDGVHSVAAQGPAETLAPAPEAAPGHMPQSRVPVLRLGNGG